MSGLWRDRNFLQLWAGQTISETGSRITRDGLPFAAVTVLGASTTDMGILQSLGGIAALVAGPLAGIAADRYRKKRLMIAADLGRAVILALVPLAAYQGWLSLVLLFFVVSSAGILTVFFDVAYQTIVPSVVERERLLEANSKLALTASTAEMIGPALTGVLVQALTAPRAILIDSLSFLASAFSLVRLRVADTPRSNSHGEEAWSEARAGLHYVFQHPLLRPLALRAATAYFFFGFFITLYTLFAVKELGIGPAVLGVVIALGGVSSFFGALLAGRLAVRFPTGHILIGATLLSGFTLLLIPLGRGPLEGAILLGLSQLLGDLSYPAYNIHELTLRQRVSRPEMLGRVNACLNMLTKGILPARALLGGLLAARIGMRAAFVVSGLGVAASSLFLLASPLRSGPGNRG